MPALDGRATEHDDHRDGGGGGDMSGAGVDGDEEVGAVKNFGEIDERSFAAKIFDPINAGGGDGFYSCRTQMA